MMNNGKTVRDAMRQMKKPVGETNPYKNDVLYTNLGQWKYPGQITRIPSGDITMQGVPYPVYGEDDLGYGQMMYPGMDYTFPGQYVTEIPMAQDGRNVNSLEADLITKVLMNRNRDKDFIQRAYALGENPGMFSLPDPDQFGSRMSHKMAWGEDETGQAYMFPTVMNPKNESIKVPNQYADYISSIGYKKETGIPYEAYGGDPSLPNIEGHYPFGGMYSKTHTHMQDGGWLDELDEEYRRGGSLYTPPKLKKKSKKYGTSKNIQSSINYLFTRNYDLFGPSGKTRYNPNSKYQVGGTRFGDLRPTSDATRVVIPNLPKKPLTKAERQESKQYAVKQAARDLQKAQEVADRKARIADSMEAQKENIIGNSNWREVLARQTQATGDKLRVSDEPNFFDDYINPGVWIGDMASSLGQAPYVAKEMDSNLPYALAIGAPLLTGALEGIGGKSTKDFITNIVSPIPFTGEAINKSIKPIVKPFSKAASIATGLAGDVAQTVDKKIITPIQFRKDIKNLQERAAKQHEYFQNPEVVKKLEDIGASPIAIKALQTPGQIDLKFVPNVGSYFDPNFNLINMDMRQMREASKRFGMTPEQVYEHELGHQMQKTINIGSPEFQNEYAIYKSKLEDYNLRKKMNESRKNNVSNPNPMAVRSIPDFLLNWNMPQPPVPMAKPTLLDKQASGMLRVRAKDKKILTPEEKEILSYYHSEYPQDKISKIGYDIERGTERLPHLREMRQAMIDAKVIPNATTPITEEHIKDFIKKNPKNRIAQVMDPNFQTNYKKLTKLFKHLPAALPVGLGVGAMQEKKYGGWLDYLD